MKPKLEDVAKLANVSKTTVSRVLNNRGYLSQKTIDKVNKTKMVRSYDIWKVHPMILMRIGLRMNSIHNHMSSKGRAVYDRCFYEF